MTLGLRVLLARRSVAVGGACVFAIVVKRSCVGCPTVARCVFIRRYRVGSVMGRGFGVGYPRSSIVGGAVLSLMILAPPCPSSPQMSHLCGKRHLDRLHWFVWNHVHGGVDFSKRSFKTLPRLGFLGDPLAGDIERPFPLPLPLPARSSRD